MKVTDTISVLMCVHSRDDLHDNLLQRAMESLTRQTYADFELIIVLDECWDHTIDVVRKYTEVLDIKIHQRARKRGLAAAKNFGLQYCTGDWIAYLDADDMWMDCKLDVQRNFMLSNPHVDFCSTNSWDLLDEVLVPNCFSVTQYLSHEDIVDMLSTENVLCHGSMIIRSIALQSLGGYVTDSQHLGKEDWELWSRAIGNGFRFAKVAERLYVYSLGTGVSR